MLHPTMLDDVGPTCWLRLNRPLVYCAFVVYSVVSVLRCCSITVLLAYCVVAVLPCFYSMALLQFTVCC